MQVRLSQNDGSDAAGASGSSRGGRQRARGQRGRQEEEGAWGGGGGGACTQIPGKGTLGGGAQRTVGRCECTRVFCAGLCAGPISALLTKLSAGGCVAGAGGLVEGDVDCVWAGTACHVDGAAGGSSALGKVGQTVVTRAQR